MITADLVVIIAGAIFILLGIILGFSKGLKLFTGGIFGKIITLVVCYFLFGIVLSWPFVQSLLTEFVYSLERKGTWICNLLLSIRIDLIVFALALFIIIKIIKKILVSIVAGIFSSENKIIQLLNKLLGIVLFAVMFVVIGLIVFQVIALVGGENGTFYQSLLGSNLGLDKLFTDNPLIYIIRSIKI